MNSRSFTTRPVVSGTFGMVTSTHWLASQIGMAVLEKGGNAFDAAVTAGLTLQVVEPHMNGLGGDAVILMQAHGEEPHVVCGQGVAPRAATIDHYRSEGLDLVPGTGLLAAVVPGAFDAWMLMLRDYGSITLSEALEPAIAYALHGYPLIPGISSTIASVVSLFREEWPSSGAVYLPRDDVPAAGALFTNKDLAHTYLRLRDEGLAAGANREDQIQAARRAFYRGFVAEAIDSYVRRAAVVDSTGGRRKGVLSGADMAAWAASYESPITGTFQDLTICKAGPWSQGPVLLQVLALLRDTDLAAMDPLGADFVHLLVEAQKLAYADRDAWYGDPAFIDVPLPTLLSEGYNAERRRLIERIASRALRPGSPDGRPPCMPRMNRGAIGAAGTGEPTRVERDLRAARGPAEGDTCHLDVIDRHGNVISATPSGGWLQSSPVIPGLGFCLGTRAQMFWLEEGLPSSLAPGRRPRTTLTPSLALNRHGEAVLAFGSPGGDSQDQWIAQFLLRHVAQDHNLQEAIDAPMLQTDHCLNSFYPRQAALGLVIMESRFPTATVADLRDRGHEIRLVEPWSLGRNCAAAKNGRMLSAAATARFQQAYAVGR